MGCSFFPRITSEGESCCHTHDEDYRTGRVPRFVSDAQLYACLKPRHPYLAPLVYAGVRLFGWIFYHKG